MGTVNFLANVVFIKFPSCGNLVCGGVLESAWQRGLSFLDGWCHRPERSGMKGRCVHWDRWVIVKGACQPGKLLVTVGHSEPWKTQAIAGRLVQSPRSRL